MNYLSVQSAVQNNFIMKTHNPFHIPSDPQKPTYLSESEQNLAENNNQIQIPSEACHKIQKVWSKRNFERSKHVFDVKKQIATEPVINFSNVKTTWGTSEDQSLPEVVEEAVTEPMQEYDSQPKDRQSLEEMSPEIEQKPIEKDESQSPSHHARRPPNAFLIFCKKHRPVVRQRFPNTENRGVTKILGEWWALLSAQEKQIYNDLAKEYKDAFLSANPDFRWYKLPAPPLRTLATRPVVTTTPKVTTPLTSPTNPLSEFTPGKLADESQLGGLTSLMNNNFSCTVSTTPKTDDYCKIERETNNNVSDEDGKVFVNIQPSLPPRPIKKRIFESYKKTVSEEDDKNITNQEFFDKVVDDIFSKQNVKEQRKSDRVCKGKRYERFMMEGRLLGVKRESKLTQCNNNNSKITKLLEPEPQKLEVPKLDLEDTIKRLAERTNVKLDLETLKKNDRDEVFTANGRVRSISESSVEKRDRSTSESSDISTKIPAPNFNLDLRIGNLPCLSYDEFLFRKRQSKKRKIRSKHEEDSKTLRYVESSSSDSHLVGSKKRKNKQSITHLNKNEENVSEDLLGLATLAMVAASTEKIEERVSE